MGGGGVRGFAVRVWMLARGSIRLFRSSEGRGEVLLLGMRRRAVGTVSRRPDWVEGAGDQEGKKGYIHHPLRL